MRPVSLPEISYAATAVRPAWADLPTAVRAAIADRLGGEVAAATSATSGFTRAFAGLVKTGAGAAFVKAAPFGPVADAYAREAYITAELPTGVRAARPLWTLQESGYFAAAFQPVTGRIPDLPWSAHDLEATLTTWHAAAEALTHPTTQGLPKLPDLVRDELSLWSSREPPTTPTWATPHLAELADLEGALPALVAGDGMLHGDLRVDNVLIDTTGDAWLCDWTWPCLGAPWFDTVTLLVSAWASGHDTDRLLEPWQPPPGGVDGALAAMSGYWLDRAAGDPGSASPHARQHHRFSGTQALTWLAARRGWAVLPDAQRPW